MFEAMCEGQLTTVSQKQSGKCCFEAKDVINNLTGLKIDKGKNANDNAEDQLYRGPTLTLTLRSRWSPLAKM